MSSRYVQKMLSQMASGEPVRVVSGMGSVDKVTQLAAVAQQFGYEYANAWQGGGAQGQGYTILIVPDPSPQARERAARDRARYPDAADGGALPPLAPEAVELLEARITLDLTAGLTEKQKLIIAGVGGTVLAACVALQLGPDAESFIIGGVAWTLMMGLIPFGVRYSRRSTSRYTALLEAAGFTLAADRTGRLRHVPPGGQLPGHGNPFAGEPPTSPRR
ncbi:hypothetical protein [Streptomyces sp. NPDC050738]|uniref:hypothetical protein n=1 Tax=Streptomyces sp. NPDC050738 TaxID=3154744 RepID=UPI00341BBB40